MVPKEPVSPNIHFLVSFHNLSHLHVSQHSQSAALLRPPSRSQSFPHDHCRTDRIFHHLLQWAHQWGAYQSRCHPRCIFFKETVKRWLENDAVVCCLTAFWMHARMHFQQDVLRSGRTSLHGIPLGARFVERLHIGVHRYFLAHNVHLNHVKWINFFRAKLGLGSSAHRSDLLLLPHVLINLWRFATHLHFLNPAIQFSFQLQGMMFIEGIDPNTLLACLYLAFAQCLGAWVSQYVFHKKYLKQAKFWKDQFRWLSIYLKLASGWSGVSYSSL